MFLWYSYRTLKNPAYINEALYDNFKGYVDFFLLQDLVSSDYSSIKYLIPFKDFDTPALPCNVEEYVTYKHNMIEFITNRNNRILNLVWSLPHKN